jgi:hypothetical protein
MQAEFEMKVQVIRCKGRATRLFVNVPLPLATALGFAGGGNASDGNCWLAPNCA